MRFAAMSRERKKNTKTTAKKNRQKALIGDDVGECVEVWIERNIYSVNVCECVRLFFYCPLLTSNQMPRNDDLSLQMSDDAIYDDNTKQKRLHAIQCVYAKRLNSYCFSRRHHRIVPMSIQFWNSAHTKNDASNRCCSSLENNGQFNRIIKFRWDKMTEKKSDAKPKCTTIFIRSIRWMWTCEDLFSREKWFLVFSVRKLSKNRPHLAALFAN